jgi:hypothetical protein
MLGKLSVKSVDRFDVTSVQVVPSVDSRTSLPVEISKVFVAVGIIVDRELPLVNG